MDKIIEISHLNKKFGDFTAIDDLSFSLESGKIYGIIGPNGAGKSTTMSLLMGLIYPTLGTGSVKGFPLGSQEAKQIMGYSPEFPSFYSDMNCLEYLVYMGTLSGLTYDEAIKRTKELIKEFDLEAHIFKKVNKFSTGMKKKVGLIQAMIHDPEILLLDEPTANLDPTSRMEIIDTLKRLVTQKKMTVLISSHVLTELEMIIDHVIMINKGRIVLDQPLSQVQEMFNKEVLLVSCSDNLMMEDYLTKRGYDCSLLKDKLRIKAGDKKVCKQEIVEFIYQNHLTLDLLQEEAVTLENLYKQLVEGEQNEAHI
ncbi:MAG: ABC transporter ATP-binding protein [Beduini sp.]|uniref:ABC transporter ATP-binding protein n=1 Tax=Beduini sp. TaxID=1922300 RepID=UPI0011CBC445